MRGKPHSDDTKAAVMAALLTGQGVAETARRYELDEATVRNWKRKLKAERSEELTAVNAEKAAAKEHHFEALLFEYLHTNLQSLSAQARVCADEAYLRRFPPQQLAVLHGVMADKAVRLLEALQGDPEAQENAAEPDAPVEPREA